MNEESHAPKATSWKDPKRPGFSGPHKIDRAVFTLRGQVYVAEHDGVELSYRLVREEGQSLPAKIDPRAMREISAIAAPKASMAGRAVRALAHGLYWCPGPDGDYTSQRAACIEAADGLRLPLAVDVLRRATKPGGYQVSGPELDQLSHLVERGECPLPAGLEVAVL